MPRRGPIQNEEISPDAIQLVENIDVHNVEVIVSAETTGIKTAIGRIYLDSEDVKHMKAAYLDLRYVWAPTADGTIQLYNVTDDVVVWESETFTGEESSERARYTLDKTKILAGKEYMMRVNITNAGAAGETVRITRALLKIVKGIS